MCYHDMMKIGHFISSCNQCSRRQAEKCVLDGLVKLNGEIHTNVATRVQDSDIVELNGQRLAPENVTPKLWGYYKPAGVLTTHNPDFNTKTVFSLVHDRIGYVISVGRLDYLSEGLLLLTNSNKLAHELMNGEYKRKYMIYTQQSVRNVDWKMFTEPFLLDGIEYKSWKVQILFDNCIEIELIEGKNREIRRVLGALEINIDKLIRLSYHKYNLNCTENELVEYKI